MNQQREDDLYGVLETILRGSKEPLDCVQLFDRPEVREHAATVNRVSDYLGNLWRKGKLLRLPAPRRDNSRAQWLYMWKPPSQRAKTPAPDVSQAVEFNPTVNSVLNRPHLSISEEGDTIVLTLPQLTITIKQTRGG